MYYAANLFVNFGFHLLIVPVDLLKQYFKLKNDNL